MLLLEPWTKSAIRSEIVFGQQERVPFLLPQIPFTRRKSTGVPSQLWYKASGIRRYKRRWVLEQLPKRPGKDHMGFSRWKFGPLWFAWIRFVGSSEH